MDSKELFRVSITGIIYRERSEGVFEYLITRRSLSKKAFPGRWTVPGGGLSIDDFNDLPKTPENQWYRAVEKTLVREIKEEVGLEVSGINYLLDIAHILPGGTPSIILSFYCKYSSGEVKHDEDTIDSKWITLGEGKDYDLIEGILGEIEMVENKLKG